MEALHLVPVLVGGLLTGLVFALISLGLSLLWGVTDLINFAYAEGLMVAMYATLVLSEHGVDPLAALPLVIVVSVVLNLLTYWILIKRAMRGSFLTQIFVTFGLLLFLRNAALFLFGPDPHVVQWSVLQGTFTVLGIYLSRAQLLAAGAGLALAFLLHLFLGRTVLGFSVKATAEDREAAALIGIDTERIYLLTWALTGVCLGIAGDLTATFFAVVPAVGDVYLLIVFAVVALGGLGSIWGSVVGGIAIGLLQGLAGFYLPAPAMKYALVFLIFFLVLLFRSRGWLGRRT